MYVFQYQGENNCPHIALLSSPNIDATGHFGIAVAVEDDRIIVGARGENGSAESGFEAAEENENAPNAGAVYVFEQVNPNDWQHMVAYIKAYNAQSSSEMGFSVAISGGQILRGAHQEDSDERGREPIGEVNSRAQNSGAAYVIEF